MTSVTETLVRKYNLPSPWPLGVQYEAIVGSQAYGSTSDWSDQDYVGFCVPPAHTLFPHLRGEVPGFGPQTKNFEQLQHHHIEHMGRIYDVTMYSVIKFFQLCMDNNPNILDALYSDHVTFQTEVGSWVRDNRSLFLHKQGYLKFRGYAISQLHRMNRQAEGKRKELIDEFGYDVKAAAHAIRLLDETTQLLKFHTMDLQNTGDLQRSIRNGEWTEEEIRDEIKERLVYSEWAFENSKLPDKPNYEDIRHLLLGVLLECGITFDVLARMWYN